MKLPIASLAALLMAVPAAAQPFILELEKKPAEAPPPPPSPVPVAPPQAEAAPGAKPRVDAPETEADGSRAETGSQPASR